MIRFWSAFLQKKENPEPELFTFTSRERRKWFRIRPSKEHPILLRIDDQTVEVRDIGASGLSFPGDGSLPLGAERIVRMDLPGDDPSISLEMKVIEIDERHVCHCTFRRIESASVERIHQYVLNRQKEILQKKKASKDRKNHLTDQNIKR